MKSCSGGKKFTFAETHQPQSETHRTIQLTSDGLGWTGLHMARTTEKPHFTKYDACNHPLLALILDGPVSYRRHIGGVSHVKKFYSGNFNIAPAGMSFEIETASKIENILISIRQTVIDEVAADLFKVDPKKIELLPTFAKRDPLVEQLLLAAHSETEDPSPCSELYIDQLSRVLASRLLRVHSSASGLTEKRTTDTRFIHAQKDRIRSMIEAHMDTSLSLEHIARDSGYSPRHFSRLFKLSVGLTPYQFVMKCRIERAANLLAHSEFSISRISSECGFANQEHLTRSFRSHIGVTPGLYRRVRKS